MKEQEKEKLVEEIEHYFSGIDDEKPIDMDEIRYDIIDIIEMSGRPFKGEIVDIFKDEDKLQI